MRQAARLVLRGLAVFLFQGLQDRKQLRVGFLVGSVKLTKMVRSQRLSPQKASRAIASGDTDRGVPEQVKAMRALPKSAAARAISRANEAQAVLRQRLSGGV